MSFCRRCHNHPATMVDGYEPICADCWHTVVQQIEARAFRDAKRRVEHPRAVSITPDDGADGKNDLIHTLQKEVEDLKRRNRELEELRNTAVFTLTISADSPIGTWLKRVGVVK